MNAREHKTTKQNTKKNFHAASMTNQRQVTNKTQNTNKTTKSTLTKTTNITNGLLSPHTVNNNLENNVVEKMPTTTLNRNQVSANWNCVAGALKSHHGNIPQHKKIGFLSKSSAIALDCEMVGIGPNGRDHMLARVSIVNEKGEVIMDKYVKPTQPVIDYRTRFSGITPEHLENAYHFADVQAEVGRIKFNRILVGHALHNDLRVLRMEHPKRLIRDTSIYKKCREFSDGRSPSLRLLTNCILNYDIQADSHCSVEDAQATMAIYKRFARSWEKSMQKYL